MENLSSAFFSRFFFKSSTDKSWVYTLGFCWFPCLEVLRANENPHHKPEHQKQEKTTSR